MGLSEPAEDASPVAIDRLVGVYDAKGSLAGELKYLLRKHVGRDHCSLCDITHGTVREKSEWRRCRAELPVEMATVHLDEQDSTLAKFTEGHTPCVVAETAEGLVLLVDDAALAACTGSPECLSRTIAEQAAALGLQLG